MFLAAGRPWEAPARGVPARRREPQPPSGRRSRTNTPEAQRPVVLRCQQRGVRILPLDNPDYPLALARIPDMPLGAVLHRGYRLAQ